MKTIKIIDLLNMIANGEEVPERIKYDTKEMKYDHNKQDYLGYYSNGNGEWLFQYLFDRCKNTEHFINDEVEIIEEKKIPMKIYWNLNYDTYTTTIGHKDYEANKDNFEELSNMYRQKINEIIDYINKNEEEK